jgi:hypothetical protein
MSQSFDCSNLISLRSQMKNETASAKKRSKEEAKEGSNASGFTGTKESRSRS